MDLENANKEPACGSRERQSLDYKYLCIHPYIDMLVRYKPLKFDIFDEQAIPTPI